MSDVRYRQLPVSPPVALRAVQSFEETPQRNRLLMIDLIRNTDKTDEEIAKETNFSLSHVSKTRRRYKKKIEPRKPHTVQEIRDVREMLNEGMSVDEIQNKTGFSRGFILGATIDIRLLLDKSLLKAVANKAGMQELKYVTLKRLEVMYRMEEITWDDFEDMKSRLPVGELTEEIRSFMLKTGRTINICPSGKRLGHHNRLQDILYHRRMKLAAKNVSEGRERGWENTPW